MADVHDAKTRSYNMARVRSKDTKPELTVRKRLFAEGFRYRLHDKRLPGSPDIILPGYKTVIFVHGCFWHGHVGCKASALPQTRTEWWQQKIQANKTRDARDEALLKQEGWTVLVLYECELKAKAREATLANLISVLHHLKQTLA
jgi:DNA mismatch endonuclease, patch repair protein